MSLNATFTKIEYCAKHLAKTHIGHTRHDQAKWARVPPARGERQNPSNNKA